MRLRLFILTTIFLTLSLAWLAQSAPAAIKFPPAAIEETGQFLLEDNRPPISAHFSNSPLDECRYCSGFTPDQCSIACYRYGYKYYWCSTCYCNCSN
ncbi:hypothetical protein RhiirA1_430159 [Rhizophagus irregularis]|uniref:Uncharacterized protein n=1 Tax=Rhizophagus irregularis TaxID=588596 RepID=A0A2I1FLR2_9GLOM|nr:hypothetical protein RhiirA1_430159 [Rhizophagus irregularis]PKY35316.1 hypothetical protein RhiirB3_421067 [Rhizophagus irregularis]